jgi:hypothetical protein
MSRPLLGSHLTARADEEDSWMSESDVWWRTSRGSGS